MKKKYNIGIIYFSLMHVFLLISFYTKYSVNSLEFIILAVILITLFLVQTIEKWKLGKQKNILSIYTLLVALMSAKSISILCLYSGFHQLLIGLGGLCFIISDLILGIWNYHDSKEKFVMLNRFIYFIVNFYLLLVFCIFKKITFSVIFILIQQLIL